MKKYFRDAVLCLFVVWAASFHSWAEHSAVYKADKGPDGLAVETNSEKLSKRNKCCKLGREVAKIGDMCSFTESLAALQPNPKHYHVMKTRLWMQDGANPISNRKLEKCKRFKAYYEKCCRTESANIDKDIKRRSHKQRQPSESNTVTELPTEAKE